MASLILIFVVVTWLVVIISIYFVFLIEVSACVQVFNPFKIKSQVKNIIYNIGIQDDLASYLALLSSEDVLQV